MTEIEAAEPDTTTVPQRKLLIPLLLTLAGIVAMLYPVVATEYNNYRQREYANRYTEEVASVPSQALADELAEARAYNGSIEGIPILDPWLEKAAQDPGSTAYRSYLDQLSLLHSMARVRIPDINVNLPIYHGTTDDVLSRGVGHLYGTSLPVGGPGTHTVLTAHTALATATMFDNLDEVKEGAVFYIDVAGETLAYQVDQIKVVLPEEVDDLRVIPGEDHATLITCTPYSVNTHRLLVRGVRIPYEVGSDTYQEPKAFEWGLQPWMWWLILGAAIGISFLIFVAVRLWRASKKQPEAETADTP